MEGLTVEINLRPPAFAGKVCPGHSKTIYSSRKDTSEWGTFLEVWCGLRGEGGGWDRGMLDRVKLYLKGTQELVAGGHRVMGT